MVTKSALAQSHTSKPARRPALDLAAQTASTSYRVKLPPEVLSDALRTGLMPADFAPHIGTLLEEASMTLLSKVVEQIHAATGVPRLQIWNNMDKLAVEWKIPSRFGAPTLLQD